MSEEPLYPNALVGYRTWIMWGTELRSTGFGNHIWQPGPNRASCRRAEQGSGENHPAPSPDCECGLYALHELEDDWRHAAGLMVAGAVAARGRVQIHADGFRAEQMRIIALLCPQNADAAHTLRVRAVARAYGVPMVRSFEELRAIAARRGEPAPKALRPVVASKPEGQAPKPDKQAPPQENERVQRRGFLAVLAGWFLLRFAVGFLVGSLLDLRPVAATIAYLSLLVLSWVTLFVRNSRTEDLGKRAKMAQDNVSIHIALLVAYAGALFAFYI